MPGTVLSTLIYCLNLIITMDYDIYIVNISILQTKEKMKPSEVKEVSPGHIVIERKRLNSNLGSQLKCGF